MITVKILGTGCPKCKKTTQVVEQVIAEKGIDATVIKVEDIMEIMKYNVLTTPVLVVNEDIKIKGRVPSPGEVADLLIA